MSGGEIGRGKSSRNSKGWLATTRQDWLPIPPDRKKWKLTAHCKNQRQVWVRAEQSCCYMRNAAFCSSDHGTQGGRRNKFYAWDLNSRSYELSFEKAARKSVTGLRSCETRVTGERVCLFEKNFFCFALCSGAFEPRRWSCWENFKWQVRLQWQRWEMRQGEKSPGTEEARGKERILNCFQTRKKYYCRIMLFSSIRDFFEHLNIRNPWYEDYFWLVPHMIGVWQI